MVARIVVAPSGARTPTATSPARLLPRRDVELPLAEAIGQLRQHARRAHQHSEAEPFPLQGQEARSFMPTPARTRAAAWQDHVPGGEAMRPVILAVALGLH